MGLHNSPYLNMCLALCFNRFLIVIEPSKKEKKLNVLKNSRHFVVSSSVQVRTVGTAAPALYHTDPLTAAPLPRSARSPVARAAARSTGKMRFFYFLRSNMLPSISGQQNDNWRFWILVCFSCIFRVHIVLVQRMIMCYKRFNLILM